MKKLYLYLIAGFIALAVVVTPKVVESFVEDEISKEIEQAKSNGIDFKVLNKEGYFTTKRDVQISISDTTKFLTYLIDSAPTMDDQVSGLMKQMVVSLEVNLNDAFNGTTVSGTITNSNLIPSDIVAQLYLSKFSPSIMDNVAKSQELIKIVKPMLDEKQFLIDMVVDSNKNIKRLKVKDIDQKHKYIDNIFVFKYLGDLLEQQTSGSRTKGIYVLDKYEMGLGNDILSTGVAINDVNYKFQYTNDFEGQLDFVAKNIEYFVRYKEYEKLNDEFSLKKLDAFSNVEVLNNAFSADLKYKIEDLKKLDPKIDMSIKNSRLDIKLSGLDKKSVIDLSKNLQAITIDPNMLESSVQTILNKGFKSKIAFDIKDFKISDTTVEDIQLDLKLAIDKNNEKIDQNFSIIDNLLKLNGTLRLLNSDVTKLVQGNANLDQFISSAKKDGEHLIFDLKFDEKFYVNEKAVN